MIDILIKRVGQGIEKVGMGTLYYHLPPPL